MAASKPKPGTELLSDLADRITTYLVGLGHPEESARHIAETIALDMANNWGGQLIYFPKGRFVLLPRRDRQIYAAFNGSNIKDLVQQYGVCEQHIYRIIKAMRRSDLADRHDNLFPPDQPA